VDPQIIGLEEIVLKILKRKKFHKHSNCPPGRLKTFAEWCGE